MSCEICHINYGPYEYQDILCTICQTYTQVCYSCFIKNESDYDMYIIGEVVKDCAECSRDKKIEEILR